LERDKRHGEYAVESDGSGVRFDRDRIVFGIIPAQAQRLIPWKRWYR
jgi:hypothetical protein